MYKELPLGVKMILKLAIVSSVLLCLVVPWFGVLMAILCFFAKKQLLSFGFRPWVLIVAYLFMPVVGILLF